MPCCLVIGSAWIVAKSARKSDPLGVKNRVGILERKIIARNCVSCCNEIIMHVGLRHVCYR